MPVSRRNRISAGLTIGLGIATLVLALPRLITAISLLPGDHALGRILDKRPVTAVQLEDLLQSRKRSLTWVESGRAWTELALARLMLLEDGRVIDAEQDLGPVRDALIRGLMRAPANPYAWTRLAYVEDLRNGPTSAGIEMIRLAILTGPYEARLLLPRLDLALRGWQHIPVQDRDLVVRQIRWAWSASPGAFGQLIRALRSVGVARSAPTSDPNPFQAQDDRIGAAR